MYGSDGPGGDSGGPGGCSGGPGGGSGAGEGAFKDLEGGGGSSSSGSFPKSSSSGSLARFVGLKSVRFQWIWMKIGRGETSGCPAPSYIGQTPEKQSET